jgi:serine/threonine-protein kinase
VRDDGVLKIIDFGFGKRVHTPVDFDKSVSLNLWCEPPNEFADRVYDFTTEVYFVGKLFEHIIQANELSDFKYSNLLENMCQIEPTKRLPGFSAVMQEIQNDMFFEIGFNEDETETYRDFANALGRHVSKIEAKTRYQDDTDKMLVELENVYRSFLLEETIPDCSVLLNTLLKGAYYYSKKNFPVRIVREFLHLTKISSPEKRRILLSNLHTRLDAVERYTEPDTSDFDDIPF